MKKHLNLVIDINNPITWVKYRKNLCRDCRANCCTMPVEAKLADLVWMEVIDDFEAEELPKQTAKKLKKRGIRCTIYHKRPDICPHHPLAGPRPLCVSKKGIGRGVS